MKNEFLQLLHPVYKAQAEFWRQQERRLRGGAGVLHELWPFDWETPDGDQLRRRREAATYINFPDLFMRTVVGHLMRHAPVPDVDLDFGTLGKVARAEGSREPTRAELVYYNTDGAGQDGSQWNNFWSRIAVWAGATGHRWILIEAPRTQPRTEADEQRGLRPYLVHLSPLQVTNWEYEEGQLAMAIVRVWRRNLRVAANGQVEGNEPEQGYVLMTRAGWAGFGPEYEGGGWWEFDSDGNLVDGAHGTWDKTQGEIPLVACFYERDDGEVPDVVEGGNASPSMSRSATFELGQLAVSYMNISSAADFDAWDAAASLTYLVGVSKQAYELAASLIQQGSRTVPVPADPMNHGGAPSIHDGSTGAVASEVFDRRLTAKRAEAMEIAARESSGSADASGAAKEAGFADIKAPILARLASEIEQAQNSVIRFLELRFGSPAPTGYVEWERDFDLAPLVQDIDDMFSLERLSGYTSPTLGAQLMVRAAKERRLLKDGEEAVVLQEYKEAAERARTQSEQAGRAFGSLGIFG